MLLDPILEKAQSRRDRLSPLEKAIEFYRSAVEMEQAKESDVKGYAYRIEDFASSTISVRIPECKAFYDLWKRNVKSPMPVGLKITLRVVQDGRVYPFFVGNMWPKSFQSLNCEEEPLVISVDSLMPNAQNAFDLEIDQQQVDDLSLYFRNELTLIKLNEAIRRELGEGIVLEDNVYLSLQNFDPLEEMKTVGWDKTVEQNAMLSRLLLHTSEKKKSRKKSKIDEDALLKVTMLDDAQLSAVKVALDSDVSVITGPPGTGKTQVILNIIANAFAQGKSVVVASKNNKAVDNVKERFDQMDPLHYMLRGGNSDVMKSQAVPAAEGLAALLKKWEEDGRRSPAICRTYEHQAALIRQEIENGELLVQLEPKIQKARKKIEAIGDEIAKIKAELNEKLSQMVSLPFAAGLSTYSVSAAMNRVAECQRRMNERCDGMFGFIFKWFGVSSFAGSAIEALDSFPPNLKRVEGVAKLRKNIGNFDSVDSVNAFCAKLIVECKKVHQYVSAREYLIKTANDKVANQEEKAAKLRREISVSECKLQELQRNRQKEIRLAAEAKQWIRENSVAVLNGYIEEALLSCYGASETIEKYAKCISKGGFPKYSSDYYGWGVNLARQAVNVLRLFAVTNLSISKILPMAPEVVDMVIIDEASQCDVASALPLIARARQVVVIGDPMQLRHIAAITNKDEKAIKIALGVKMDPHLSYVQSSLWDYCYSYLKDNDLTKTNYSVLSHHYRCHPEIMNYSNRMFYQQLEVSLSIDTNVDKLKGDVKGMYIVPIRGSQGKTGNRNREEAQRCANLAVELVDKFGDSMSVGITSPFRMQSNLIEKLLPSEYRRRVEVHTVHQYQGEEKDLMIYSPMVTHDSPASKIKWIDQSTPNLVNVAVTRAKSALFVVCDKEYIEAHSSENMPLGNLVRGCRTCLP
jgi:RecA/RadA recombinase